MSKEADRLIAEFLGKTDHLKKWCSDAGAGEPLQLCIEDPGETQRPDSCRHLAKGGCWDDCKSKATIDPPSYSTLDSAAWDALRILQDRHLLTGHVKLMAGGGVELLLNGMDDKKRVVWGMAEDTSDPAVRDHSLAKALEDAMVEEYCTGCKSVACVPRPKELMKHRIKPAIERAMKGGNGE